MPVYKDDSSFDYTRELSRYKVILDPKEIAQLFYQWRDHGDHKAYEQLVYGNHKLVFSIAQKYLNRGMSLHDLTQEGFLGLMRALKDFDPTQGTIATYATWWIRQNMSRALADKGRTVRITVNKQAKMNCIYKAVKLFYDKHERQPTDKEVHNEIRVMAKKKDATILSKKMTLEDVVFCRPLLSFTDTSLDAPVNPTMEDSMSFEEVLPDVRVDTEAKVTLKHLQQTVLGSIEKRLAKEKNPAKVLTILRLRFEKGQTLEKVGARFSLTRERIRQIEENFIAKIAQDSKIPVEGIKKILDIMPMGAEKEKRVITQDAPPKTLLLPDLFDILCQHLIDTPAGPRIVKEPVRTLQIREKLSAEEAEIALKEMQRHGLIIGEAPWTVIQIIPEVAIPEYDSKNKKS